MYCAHEIVAETVDEIIAHAIVHARGEHSFADEQFLPELVALWRSRIRDQPDARAANID